MYPSKKGCKTFEAPAKEPTRLVMFWKSVNNMKSSAVCHKLSHLSSKAQSVSELTDLADCGFVDD